MLRATLFVLSVLAFSLPVFGVKEKGPVTKADAVAIALAIEDEVYDRTLQMEFGEVGRAVGPDEWQLNLYIEPEIKDGLGRVIYIFLPFGEVTRLFWIRDDSLAVLHGDPDIGFPPTQPDTLTLHFFDDEELCELKRAWLKSTFVISNRPPAERIREAVERQKKRTGRSIWEEKQKERSSQEKR